MSDKRDELERELSRVAGEAHMWKQLLEHPAWEAYQKFVEEQQRLRSSTCMLTPISTEYSAFAQEFYKGEYAGLGLALALPYTQFELADNKRKAITLQLENESETETRVVAAESRVDDDDPFRE